MLILTRRSGKPLRFFPTSTPIIRLLATVFLLALITFGQILQGAATNYHDPALERLILKQKEGNIKNKMAEKIRDWKIRHLDAQLKARTIDRTQYDIEKAMAHDTYGKASRRLTQQYRVPVVERLQKLHPEIRDSLGTDFYQKNPDGSFKEHLGRRIINPEHRGWKGDFDFKGSPKALDTFGKIMKANGAELEISYRADGSTQGTGATQRSVKSLEFTVNSETIKDGARSSLEGAKDRLNGLVDERLDLEKKIKGASGSQKAKLQKQLDGVQKDLKSAGRKFAIREKYFEIVSRPGFNDSINTPGSSAHRDLQDIRANDVETFNSASMKKNQVFRQSVEVEDHIKKAAKGLAASPADLHKNSDAAKAKFQGMTKSTQKAIGAVGMTDAELDKILKKNNYPGDAKAFRAELQQYKLEQKFATSGTQSDVARMQNISKDVLSASRDKASRLDTARLKQIEKSMADMSPEARARARTDIVDGQERLRATRAANLTRSKTSGFDLGKPPNIPASSTTPSKIVKYGGPATMALGLLMVKSIIDSKVHEVADDDGLILPTFKLTGKVLLELADFAGVSPADFERGMTGDLKSARANLKAWGFEDSIFNTPALLLTAAMSPVKSVVKGGANLIYQTGANAIEMAKLMATMPPAVLEAWNKQSDLEKRLLTDKFFRQATIMADRRRDLSKLELDRTIAMLNMGLSPGSTKSPAAIREYLIQSIEADSVRDEAAIKRQEAEIGKMSAEEKGAFLRKREKLRQDRINNPLARMKQAAEAQDELIARLADIEFELGKVRGAHTVVELEALRAELEGVNGEMELFKDIAERMSATDREAFLNQEGRTFDKGGKFTIGEIDLKILLRGHRDLQKNFDRMKRRIDGGLGPTGLEFLIYQAKGDAKTEEAEAEATLNDLLGLIGDPTKLTLEDLEGLVEMGLDVAAVFSALTGGEEEEAAQQDLDDALAELQEKSELAVEKTEEQREELEKEVAEVAKDKAEAEANAKEKQKMTVKLATLTKPSEQKTETVKGIWASYQGVMTGGSDNGVNIRNATLSFSIKGTVVSGKIKGTLVFESTINTFSGTVRGTFDPKTGKLKASMTGRWVGKETGGSLDGSVVGKQKGSGFSGQWGGGMVSGTWRTTSTLEERVEMVTWEEHMCANLRDEWLASGGTCN